MELNPFKIIGKLIGTIKTAKQLSKITQGGVRLAKKGKSRKPKKKKHDTFKPRKKGIRRKKRR